MNNVEFGNYLREKRKEKKLTIRQLDTYSGVSHSYISQVERGNRGIPSPDVLKKLSKPLGVDYEELMVKAGHIDEISRSHPVNVSNNDGEQEGEFTLPDEIVSKVITEAEAHYGVSLRDDPVVESAVRDLINNLAKMKKASQPKD